MPTKGRRLVSTDVVITILVTASVFFVIAAWYNAAYSVFIYWKIPEYEYEPTQLTTARADAIINVQFAAVWSAFVVVFLVIVLVVRPYSNPSEIAEGHPEQERDELDVIRSVAEKARGITPSSSVLSQLRAAPTVPEVIGSNDVISSIRLPLTLIGAH